jgi:hypothetical protein
MQLGGLGTAEYLDLLPYLLLLVWMETLQEQG